MFGKKQCRRDEETVPAALLFQKGNCSVLPFPMEIPGRGYDSLQVIILGIPAQYILGLFTGGYELGRVSGTPWRRNGRNRMAGYLPCTFNYLFDGKAHAVSQVKDVAFTAPVQVFYRQNMSCLLYTSDAADE